jgi:predicted amidohydrolase
MRIACAQFSPQVGDIDNNLNRADAVLNKAKPEQLENLDLLILPELAFTGMLISTSLSFSGFNNGTIIQ